MKLAYGSGVLVMVAGLFITSPGLAQTPPAAAAITPPPAAEATPPSAAPSEVPSAVVSFPAGPAAESCFPSCRKGFVCHAGACISNCNPPCASNERCTETNECVFKSETHFADVPLPPIDPGAEVHDGFYFRGTLGIGGGGAQRETGSGKAQYRGGAGFFSVDFGGTPVENLVIFGRLSEFGLVEPEVKLDDVTYTGSRDDSIGFGMIGVGMSYYFMPINLYVGGAVGPAAASLGTHDDVARSKVGFAMDLEAGKEWWVTEDWGLGVALRLSLANVPPGNGWTAPSKHLGAAALGVLFSATYN